MSDKIWNGFPPEIAISFDLKVHITETLYAPVSFAKLFSDLGGSLGFWLGAGLLQICFMAVDFIKYIKSNIC